MNDNIIKTYNMKHIWRHFYVPLQHFHLYGDVTGIKQDTERNDTGLKNNMILLI